MCLAVRGVELGRPVQHEGHLCDIGGEGYGELIEIEKRGWPRANRQAVVRHLAWVYSLRNKPIGTRSSARAGNRTLGLMKIRAYESRDEDAVVALWRECGLTRSWNDPRRDIQRKLTEQPELFLVGIYENALVATAMIGFERSSSV